MDASSNRIPTALWIILGLTAIFYAITYLAVLTNNPEAIHQHGELSHREAALHLLEHGEYPVTHRLPLYPILMALLYAIFGTHTDVPLIVVLAFTSLTTIYLAYLIGKRLFGQTSGLIAAGLLALEMHLLHEHPAVPRHPQQLRLGQRK